jgi:hypothetical protein
MTRLRWKISDLMLLIVAAGIVLAGYRAFWDPNQPNYVLLLAVYLAVLTTGTLALRNSRGRWRKGWAGYAVFGWIYFVSVLHAGFGITTIYDAQAAARNTLIGLLVGVLCGIAASWIPDRPRGANVPLDEHTGPD